MVNPESNIEILVEVNKLVKVDMPTNDKAILTINGKDYKKGQSAYVQYNRPLDFSVRTTDEAAIKQLFAETQGKEKQGEHCHTHKGGVRRIDATHGEGENENKNIRIQQSTYGRQGKR